MKTLLVGTTEIIIITAILATIIILFFIVSLIKEKHKHDNSGNTRNLESGTRNLGDSANLAITEKYMFRKELKFLAVLNKILPKEFVAFPKVGVANLVEPVGNKLDYNAISDKFVDFAIFEFSSMKPILAIDIFDNTLGDCELKEQEPNVNKALLYVGIKLLSYPIESQYDEELIKSEIFKIIKPVNDTATNGPLEK
ncbi:MAG: DUF2726 domain-containing protein [Clostridia bacterium]